MKRNDPQIIYQGLIMRRKRALIQRKDWKYILLMNYQFFFGCEYL